MATSTRTDDATTDILVAIGVIGAVVAVVAATMCMNGYVLSVMWTWFIVPLGVPAIGLAHAVGIAGTVGALRYTTSKADDDKSVGKLMLETFLVRPAVILGLGYIVKGFM